MLQIQVGTAGEYMHFVCSRCRKDTQVRVLTYDRAIVQLRFSCEKCGEDTYKIANSWGFEPPIGAATQSS